MGFSQALSGIDSAAQQLDVVGNNISNSQTAGFKGSSVQFSDVFANSQVGMGTRVAGVVQDFTNGSLESTGRNLDLAIAGDGFYRFQQEGQVGYSRNGQLTMTANGDLVNAQGAKLMGYGLADQNDPFSNVVPGGQPVALNIPANDMPAQATGAGNGENPGVQAIYNLDAGIDHTNPELLSKVEVDDVNNPGETLDINYHYSNSFTVYDSLGNVRNATIYYEKTGNNTWAGRVTLDGVYLPGSPAVPAGDGPDGQANTDDDQAYVPATPGLNDFTLSFGADGKLATDAEGNTTGVSFGNENAGFMMAGDYAQINFSSDLLGGEAADLSFDFTLAGTTQYAADSLQKTLTQDGYTSGALIGISIENDGTIMRNFSNEKSMPAGQIVLANFRNPEGLSPMGDNLWRATAEAGVENIGVAGTGQLGSIESGTLEASNVDLTTELVDLIIAQRNYQANTNSIRTQSEVMDAIAQLR